MGLVIGACVALAVIGIVVLPFFRTPFNTRRSASVPTTAPQHSTPTAARALSGSATPARRVVVRANGSSVPARPATLAQPVAPIPVAPTRAAIEAQVQDAQRAVSKEHAALEELDFEHALGAVSDTDYAELQTHTNTRIDMLNAQIAALMPPKDV